MPQFATPAAICIRGNVRLLAGSGAAPIDGTPGCTPNAIFHGTVRRALAYTEWETNSKKRMTMKKILLIALAVLIAAGLVAFMVIKQQSGYTKVLTATVSRQELTSVVSGTGQIKPKNIVNVGATSFGRITRFYVKEGDHVKKGQILATVESVQQESTVNAQQATISAAKTDISSYVAAEKTAQANVEHAQADLEQKKLQWDRAQSLYKSGIMSRQDYETNKANYDLDVAALAQAVARLSQD